MKDIRIVYKDIEEFIIMIKNFQITFIKVLLISLLLLNMVIQTQAGGLTTDSTSQSNLSSAEVRIPFANYTDLSKNGIEDDVYAIVEVDLFNNEVYTFDYYVKLTLPSGLYWEYLFVITTNVQSFKIIHHFYHHAIESGWYIIDVVLTLHTGAQFIVEETLIFDPPGGTSGSDPDLSISFE
jgi:hypothetical protein